MSLCTAYCAAAVSAQGASAWPHTSSKDSSDAWCLDPAVSPGSDLRDPASAQSAWPRHLRCQATQSEDQLLGQAQGPAMALVVRDPDSAVITASTRGPALTEEEQLRRRNEV